MMNRLQIAVFLLCFHVCNGLSLIGKLAGVPESFQLQSSEKVVNGHNLSGRCSAQLTSLINNDVIKAPVTANYEFKFFDVPSGKYDLVVSCHDFLFRKDRYTIDVNDTSITATHYYLNKDEVDEPIEITNMPLVFDYGNTKEYYEIRSGSVKDIVMNSPVGFIFKNTTYTLMFVFCVVMMVGPTVLKAVNPDMARRLEEIQQEQRSKQQVQKLSPKEKEQLVQRRGA